MKDFFEFKWKYLLQKIKAPIINKHYTNNFLFITHTGSKDWILGAKARRLSANFIGKSEVIYSSKFKNIPIAPGYFFLHQKYFAKALRNNPHLRFANTIVMFTHPEWNKYYSKNHAKYTLDFASKVICLNKKMADELIQLGIEKSKIEVFHLASDPDFFMPKLKKRSKTVGFCCYYSARKNPDLIFNLVVNMPELDFILIGQNWHNYPNFEKLISRSNFTYFADQSYEKYPELYNMMDIFVSPSFLEGGPVPILEAMLCNLVPVASDTGFCPDIIRHGENGYLFDPYTASVEHVCHLIKLALKLDVDVRQEVLHHSWKSYGEKISQLNNSLSKKP
jgi:glycosyltransferase involved in cell wall biosynthesis